MKPITRKSIKNKKVNREIQKNLEKSISDANAQLAV